MDWRSKPVRALAALALAGVFGTGCDELPDGPERGRVLYVYCQQCHGLDGAGNELYRAPAIAGLPEWYIEAQLVKFRTGARGDHPDDTDGLKMRPMSRTLSTDADVTAVSEYIAQMPMAELEPTLTDGVASRGEAHYKPCIECHGEKALGNQEKSAPPIVNSSDWYMLSQLLKFKAGIRGTDPLDTTGAQMRAMTMGLPDEQAMKDVIAHIKTLK